MYDASNRKDIRRAEKAAKAAEQERINYLVGAMSIWQGRAWFFDLLESCHVFADPFTGDALREAYFKGERNIGMKILLDIMQNCPDSYVQMWKEANDRRIQRDIIDARANEPATAGERSNGEDTNWRNQGSDADDDGAEA